MGCAESTGTTNPEVEDVHPKVEPGHVVKPSLPHCSQEGQDTGFAKHYAMGPKILTLEGQGVFGEVRFAEHRFFKSPVAVKVWDFEKVSELPTTSSSHSQRSREMRSPRGGSVTRVRSLTRSTGMQSPRGGAGPPGGCKSPRIGNYVRAGSKGSLGSGSSFQDPLTKFNAQVQREIDILAEIGQHRHCLRFYEFFQQQQVSYIVLELWKESLSEYLGAAPRVPVLEAQRIMAEMAHAVAHVHGTGFMHRNIKPDNFVLGSESGKTIKLMDFGTAVKIPKIGSTCWEVIGMPAYMSPEMLGAEAAEGYDQATDVWSLGATYYVMLYGSIPYCPEEHNTPAKIKAAVMFGRPEPTFMQADDKAAWVTGGVPAEAEDLVRSCLERDEHSRPMMAKVLRHAFLQEARVQSLLPVSEKSWKGSLANKVAWPSDTSTATPLSDQASKIWRV